ncbi:cell division cycle protein 123 [Anaeramoeba flamelloides]|uniref:Cell division cycle protein 123 n=1 Tax=Anaeramoeba flamelloides TaxID=1746091 RepID=A0AAV7ZI22_9EUKA|nr:cell division cycle protein 123 [Anaeramoeba flamelloides]
MLDELKKKKQNLKKVEKPKLVKPISNLLTDSGRKEAQKQVLAVNVEKWMPKLEEKNLTFQTKLCPITHEEAELIIQGCKEVQKQGFISEETHEKLLGMKEKINKTILQVKGAKENGVFVKLSSRSPKDSVHTVPDYKERYTSNLKEFLSKSNLTKPDENLKLMAIVQTSKDSMKVRNAEEAIHLLTHSKRILMDLTIALKQEQEVIENFVFREWQEIDVDMEFRGFVYNSNLNAVSQYFQYFSSPLLVEKKEEVSEKILDFFDNKIKPLLSKDFKNYVVDFAFNKENIPFVIELNAFDFSDCCLFSYAKEKHILQNGPYEFRITEKPQKGAKSQLDESVKRVIDLVDQENIFN